MIFHSSLFTFHLRSTLHSLLFAELGKAAFGGFLIEGGKVLASLLHDAYDAVEADTVLAVGKGGIEVGVECSGGRKGVALDAGYLHEAADGVARHAEVMLQPHLCRILYLCHAAAKELTGCCGGHGAGYADFTLTADIGSGDAGVLLDEIADESGGGDGVEDALFGEGVVVPQMVEHGRQYAAGATGGSRDDESAGGILFADGEGIGIDEARTLKVGFVALGLGEVDGGLALQAEWSGKDAFVVDAALNGFLHDAPHFAQVVPDLWSFTLLDVFPERVAGLLTPRHDGLHRGEGIEGVFVGGHRLLFFAFGKSAATDAIDGPFVEERTVRLAYAKLHPVGMEGQEDRGLPMDGDLTLGFENTEDSEVGHVTLACSCKGAVEGDVEGRGLGMAFKVLSGSGSWSHRMTA